MFTHLQRDLKCFLNWEKIHDILTLMDEKITAWCNRIIQIGFYLLFGIVPLLLTPWNFELFEYNKMMAVYGITVLIATAWVVKIIKTQTLSIAKTPLDIPIMLFVGSQLVSALFSIDPHVSWLGYYSRFNGGMWSILSYTFLYYALLSHVEIFVHEPKNKTQNTSTHLFSTFTTLLSITLMSGVLVAIYGVLERLGIDKNLWVQDVQNRVFSTLGQPNWLAAYLVALIPLSMAMGIRQLTLNSSQLTRKNSIYDWVKPSVYGLLSLLFFVVLLFTRSRSGLFGFVVADIVFWILVVIPNLIRYPASSKQIAGFRLGGRNDIRATIILHAFFALIVFINGTGTPILDRYITFNGWRDLTNKLTTQQSNKVTQEVTPSAVTGPALETGGTESGTIRKYVWQGAINAWKSTTKTILIGTGTETFAFAFYQFRPVEHNMTSEWDFLYNKAHNEYLNYLATTGLFGLGSYLLFIGAFIAWFIKFSISHAAHHVDGKSLQSSTDLTIMNALFAGWVSVLVTNFFGFSVVIVQLFLFLFPAIIIALRPKTISTHVKHIATRRWMIWTVIIIGIGIGLRIATYWYADSRYALGYRQIRAGVYGQAIPALLTAIALNPAEPTYHDELGSAYATLSIAAFEGNNATKAAQLAAYAVQENERAIAISPKNVNFHKTKTKVYYTLATLDEGFNTKAIDALQQALTLSPNDPKIYYNLAILVGRAGDMTKAISYLQKAKEIKPNYRDAYYALWVFYTDMKKPNDAKGVLQDYLTHIDPNDKDFLERMK